MLKDKPVPPQPVYLNFFTFKFPVTAYASILHRISGLILFMLIPYFLLLLDNIYLHKGNVLKHGYATNHCCVLLLWWLGLSALTYHLIAGIRHMIMDAGFAESKAAATVSAYAVIIISALLSILIGIRLC